MRARPDVNCVIHTHPEHAIAFSSLGKELSPMSNDGTMFSAGVPIFSETTDLITDQPRGKAVAKCMGKGHVVILRNHGIVTAGTTIEHAVFLAIKLERACRIQMLAEQAGGPKLFVKEEELAAKRGRTNRGDSQGNAFSYLVRRWHLRCGCQVPREYQADARELRPQRLQERLTNSPRQLRAELEVEARSDHVAVAVPRRDVRRPILDAGEHREADVLCEYVFDTRHQ